MGGVCVVCVEEGRGGEGRGGKEGTGGARAILDFLCLGGVTIWCIDGVLPYLCAVGWFFERGDAATSGAVG